uniref:Uncharacterized protein n=1 Tax=Tanacetum cinerariifolium TaxID=118510 RepID=A0A699H3A6_TANCI|nr:hypothetical protein [Tanacetum cinerariifolium]
MVEEDRWDTAAMEGDVDWSVVEATVVVGRGTGIDRNARVVMVVEVVVVVVLDRSTVNGGQRSWERNLTDRKVKLLKMTEGRTVLLDHPITAALGDRGDSIDKMFDEGSDVNQEHSVGKDDDVLEELRADHQSLPPSAGGKSLSALRGMVSKGSAIPSDVVEPLVMLSCHYSGSYSETASLVRSAVDVSVVTISVTTTINANVATGSKAKDAPKDFEHIGDSASSLDTETMHRVYLPRWKVTNDSVLDDPYVCLGAEVRMRAEHTFERKSELEDRCAEQATLLSEKDAKIAHLRSLLSLKEVEAIEAISLRSQLSVAEAADAAKRTKLRDLKENNFAHKGENNILSERVEALESVAASKEVELAFLSSQVVSLTADLSSFQLSRDKLNSNVASLESKRDCLATQILSRGLRLVLAKCLSSLEYLSVMSEAIGRAIDKCMQDGLAAGVSFSLLAQLEANKDASMAGIMDLLSLEGLAAETSEASQLQPSFDQLMVPIHRLEDQVIIRETSLALSLEVAHNRVQILRGDAAARRLSLMDSILSLVEPLSVGNLTVPAVLSTEVPPSPKVVFEEEELDTTLEHVHAP